MAQWLAEFAVTLVGMEATGVYWRTVFDELEPGFTCWLLNAQHLRNVPGRKTDQGFGVDLRAGRVRAGQADTLSTELGGTCPQLAFGGTRVMQ